MIHKQFNRRIFLALFFFLIASRKSSSTKLDTFKCDWCWLGAVTNNSITIKAKLSNTVQDRNYIQIFYARSSDLDPTNRKLKKVKATLLTDRIATFELVNLIEDTVYYYAIFADGRRYPAKGTLRFKTVKVGQPYNFAIACSSCAGGTISQFGTYGVSNSKVFEAIAQYKYKTKDSRDSNLDLFIHLGDMHYRNDLPFLGLKEAYLDDYRDNYDLVMNQTRQRNLYQNVPLAYIWDDHDYGTNDSDGDYPLKYLASQAYREQVPCYPLAEELNKNEGKGAIYQFFVIGRVRFIMTDSRFHQNPLDIPKESARTLLGNEQKEWLFEQLLTAKEQQRDNREGLTIWVNSVPWIAKKTARLTKSWSQFYRERNQIANFIKENKIDKLMMISGDAHMLALDDGTKGTANSYATGGGGSFPIIQAASLDSKPSFKGGPYNGAKYIIDPAVKNKNGAIPGKGQWGLLNFIDDGNKITVKVELKRMNDTLIRHTFVF